MAVLLNWTLPNGSTQSGILDAAVNEQHSTMAQITEHQVEQGVNISDHIRPMPKRITIEGVITNTPIIVPTTYMQGVTAQSTSSKIKPASNGPVVQFSALQFQGTVDRVKAVYGDLVTACLNGYLFSVTTSLASYTNMAIVNLAVPRNADNGNILRFTIDMQEIRIVQTTTTLVATPATITPISKGKQTPKTLDPVQDKQQVDFLTQLAGLFSH